MELSWKTWRVCCRLAVAKLLAQVEPGQNAWSEIFFAVDDGVELAAKITQRSAQGYEGAAPEGVLERGLRPMIAAIEAEVKAQKAAR